MSHYIHHVPGRLRVKSSHFRCPTTKAREAVRRLEALEGVREVTVNPRAASITAHYDPERVDSRQLLAMLEEAGCVGAIRYRGDGSARSGGEPKRDGVFTRALIGALAQNVAQRSVQTLVSALL